MSPTRALSTAANAANIHEERRKAAQRRDYAFDAYQFERGSQQRMAQGMLPFCGSGLFAKGGGGDGGGEDGDGDGDGAATARRRC